MYLVDRYEAPQAGTEGQLLQLIRHLDPSRYEPSMTLLRSSEYIERNSFPCPVRILAISKLASVRSVFRMLRYALHLRRENYRLVHCFFNDSSLIAPIFLRSLGIRVLVSRRDMGFWYTPGILFALRLVAPFVNRYVANCQAVKRVVERRERVPGRKVSVIYNGCVQSAESRQSQGMLARHGAGDAVPIVGIVANLKPIKRIDVVVRAFAIATRERSGAHLLIVGDTSSPEAASTLRELEALACDLGIRERVTFTGRVDKPAVYIDMFTVAVLCSESEGFPNAVIEYMQAGRPVVCSDVGGNPELIQDGRNGFLVRAGDVEALADRIRCLLADNALARRLGQAAAESVRAYTPARMVEEHMACYDEVLLT